MDSQVSPYFPFKTSTLVLAALCNKLLIPVKIGLAIGLTPFVNRYMVDYVLIYLTVANCS